MTASVIARLVSGGQAGADRAALDVAIAHGLPHGGWCPAGGWAEDLPEPPGLLARYPGLRATGSAEPAERTRRNVRDSDATLVVRRAGIASPGTDLTTSIAASLGRPVRETTDADDAAAWLHGLGTGLTLNVAGPRASEDPAAYDVARGLLESLVARPDANGRIR
jgi:hypothetical protein